MYSQSKFGLDAKNSTVTSLLTFPPKTKYNTIKMYSVDFRLLHISVAYKVKLSFL